MSKDTPVLCLWPLKHAVEIRGKIQKILPNTIIDVGSCPAKNLDRINLSESEQLTKKGHVGVQKIMHGIAIKPFC